MKTVTSIEIAFKDDKEIKKIRIGDELFYKYKVNINKNELSFMLADENKKTKRYIKEQGSRLKDPMKSQMEEIKNFKRKLRHTIESVKIGIFDDQYSYEFSIFGDLELKQVGKKYKLISMKA